jgi:hypothetical protein
MSAERPDFLEIYPATTVFKTAAGSKAAQQKTNMPIWLRRCFSIKNQERIPDKLPLYNVGKTRAH